MSSKKSIIFFAAIEQFFVDFIMSLERFEMTEEFDLHGERLRYDLFDPGGLFVSIGERDMFIEQ